MANFQDNIKYINPNERVSSEVTNRPLQQLASRTKKLLGIIDATSIGSCILLRSVNIAPDAVVGSPVYWNEDHSRFELAYAGAEKCDTGEYATIAQSDCLGLVYKKNNNATADLVLFGVVSFPNTNTFFTSSGRFYLGVEPGTITTEMPAIAVPLGSVLGPFDPCDTHINVYVNPEYVGRLFQHIHYKTVLDQQLWTTVDNFTNAPQGAVYGYRVNQDPALKTVFPPIPIDACSVDIDWDGIVGQLNEEDEWVVDYITETFGARTIAVNDSNSLITVDRNGIWWNSDKLAPTLNLMGITAKDHSEDPFRGFRVTLNFSKIQYSNQNAYVTSLQPDTNQPFRFVNCAGVEADAGDLYIQFTLPTEETPVREYDGVAVRRWNSSWKQEIASSVNAIASVNKNVRLSSNIEPFDYGTQRWYHGLVTLNVPLYSENYEIRPQIVRLNNSLESNYGDIPYIGLPVGRETGFTAVYEIPKTFSGGEPISFQLRLSLLASVMGTYPNLYINYKAYSLPDKDEQISVDEQMMSTIFDTSDPISRVIEEPGVLFTSLSDPITVYEGDTIVITIGRMADDGYLSDVGIVRMDGILNIEEDA